MQQAPGLGRFVKECFRVGMYKPSQGLIARRFTFVGLAIVFLSGSFCMWRDKVFGTQELSLIIAIVSALVGCWLSYRIINYPTFADFLVSVQVEMTKVSWPTKRELFSTTKVVLVFMALFIVVIFFYDVVFSFLLRLFETGITFFFG